ncbi:hypothetical protein D3C87_1402200 [compost metagenome]
MGKPSKRSPASKVSPSGRLTGPRARDNQNTSANNRPKIISSGRGRTMAVIGAEPEHADRAPTRRPAVM